MALHIRKIEFGTEAYKAMLDLRNEVLRHPINWPYFVFGQTEHEQDFIHLGGYSSDNVLSACCILTDKSADEVQLKQMAVASAYQGLGLGQQLLLYAEEYARTKGYKRLGMHARKSALGFYEKSGYTIVSDEFEEVGIPHFKMEKVL